MFGIQMLVDAALRFAQVDPAVVQAFVRRVMTEAPQIANNVQETAGAVKVSVEAMAKSLAEIDARLLRIEQKIGVDTAKQLSDAWPVGNVNGR